MVDAILKEKRRYASVLKLAKFLIKKDTSWDATYNYLGGDQSKPKMHRYGVSSNASSNGKGSEEGPLSGSLPQGNEEGETPLFLAAKSGCAEIVREILRLYPQAVEHIDDKGRTILHVAIKYRQLEIFEIVTKMEVPMTRLVRKVDNNGNSILHMVGTKRKDYVPEKMKSPALELQEELLWFGVHFLDPVSPCFLHVHRVKDVTLAHFIDHHNNMKQTADWLFSSSNDQLRHLAKDWLKRSSEGCSIVAVLIATVAYAAPYTVPGGPNQNTGLPILLHQPFFVVFTVTDVLSLTFALTAVVTFLSISSSPFRLEDFKHALPNKLVLGFTFLFLSVAMMMISFAATIILMIRSKEKWTKIALYTASFLPVGIFALSYFPLYSSLSKTFKYLLKKATRAFPWSRCVQALQFERPN
ncbi:hypothetical protein L1049_009894 [Liquidambar formosana]|uniref:PGG domain-containing protein n=1 Tax=Liquidambar formosana TaxID=63359 RepID=A0AAP0N6J8_LIQFO